MAQVTLKRTSGLDWTKQLYRVRATLAFGAGDTALSFTFECNGILFMIVYKQYDTTNNVTGTVAIADQDSQALYSRAALADNATKALFEDGTEHPQIALAGINTCTVTLSGAPGNAGNVFVTLLAG